MGSNQGAWITVAPREALGDRHQPFIDSSDAVRAVLQEQRDVSKGIELIGENPCGNIRFLDLPWNIGVLGKIQEGTVVDFVKVAKVFHPSHPAVIRANLFEENSTPGFTLYAGKDSPKGTILGSLSGTIFLGSEADASIRSELDGKGKMRESDLYDLEGSLEAYGGWISGDRTEENANMLVLDTSKGSNILSLISDKRNDPYQQNPQAATVRGIANVKFVQVRVKNTPRILAVAIKGIQKGTELMQDVGEHQRKAIHGIYNGAKHLHDLQKMINELTDKTQQLEDDYKVLISKQVKDNKDVKKTRNTALHMITEWKEMVPNDDYDNQMPRDETGYIIPSHLIGSLRSEVYEARFDDEEEIAEILSEHQALVYSYSFMPKRPKEIERNGSKRTVWVDNLDCDKILDIQDEHGIEISQEVGRAWQEIQDLRDLSSGVQLPWNANKKRLLENDEIIMAQQAKCMILAGYKPSELARGVRGEESNMRRKFRKIFNEVEQRTDEEGGGPSEEEVNEAARMTGKDC